MKKLLLLSLLASIFSLRAEAQWTVQNTGMALSTQYTDFISIVNPQVAWVAGAFGQEFSKTTNGGTTWSATSNINNPDAAGKTIANISAISSTTAWFGLGGSGSNVVFKTTDGGSTFTRQTMPFALEFLNMVHFFDANNGVIMGDSYNGFMEILVTSNGGNTWATAPGIPPVGAGEDYGYTGRYKVMGNNIWFNTYNGIIYHSANKGLNWTKLNPGLGLGTGLYFAFKDVNNGIAGKGTSLVRTTNGGATWTSFTPTGPLHTNDVVYVPGTANTYVSIGSTSGDYGSSFSTDGGLTWTAIDATQHLTLKFYDNQTAWSGKFLSGGLGGIAKYTGSAFVLGNKKDLDLTGVTLYPNPSNGQIRLTLPETISEASVQVLSLQGQEVFSKEIKRSENQTLDLTDLANGAYIMHLSSNKGVSTKPLIIQK